jgi:hypothetical protein
VVAGLFLAALLAVDVGVGQVPGQFGRQQQVVDAQAGIARPAVAQVVPEGVDALVGMARTDRVRPALLEQRRICRAALRLQQRVAEPRAGVVDVEVGGTTL